MKIYLIISLFLTLIIIPINSFAIEPYVSAGAGTSYLGGMYRKLPNETETEDGTVKQSFGEFIYPAFNVTLSSGLDFGKVRSEVSLVYLNNPVAFWWEGGERSYERGQGEFETMALLFTVIYDFDTIFNVVPFVGVGAGCAHIYFEENFTREDRQEIASFQDNSVFSAAFQGSLGVQYPLNDTGSLVLSLNYLYSNPEFTTVSGRPVDINYQNIFVNFGIRHNF